MQVLHQGNMQTLHDKPIEIKRAVPREQMPAGTRGGARPTAAYASAGRAFGPGLVKSSGFSLTDVSLPMAGMPGQSYSLQGLGPRLSSLTPGIPAVRTPSGLADYDSLTDGINSGLSSAQGLDLLLSSQPAQLGLNGGLGSLGFEDLALLQNTGLAANMGRSPGTPPDLSGAQSLPCSLEEVLQELHLGQLSRHHSLGHAGYAGQLLATTSGTRPQPELAGSIGPLVSDQAISAGQQW